MIAIIAYDVALALHIMAVVIAFGLPLAYPVLMPWVRRNHPEAMRGVHAIQYRLNRFLVGPATVLIALAGMYMAGKYDLYDELWVQVGIAAILIIGGVGGMFVAPASKRLAELDVAGPEYDALFRRYLRVEMLLGATVLLAIFFMATKP